MDSNENESGSRAASPPDVSPGVSPAEPKAEGAVDPAAEDESLRLKNDGNKELIAGHYLLAIKYYSEALEFTPTNAIVLSNRAQAYLKVENYGLAQLDAIAAIEADPLYAKGYYRRASAYCALNKFKLARKDFKQVCKLIPSDRDARKRLAECEKAVREAAFADAIVSEQTAPFSSTFNPDSIPLDTSKYTGPHPGPQGLLNDMDEEAALFVPGKLPRKFCMVCVVDLAGLYNSMAIADFRHASLTLVLLLHLSTRMPWKCSRIRN
jgi:serine/threonine-protein phosphatase 5